MASESLTTLFTVALGLGFLDFLAMGMSELRLGD
jgi:hypothetical protein